MLGGGWEVRLCCDLGQSLGEGWGGGCGGAGGGGLVGPQLCVVVVDVAVVVGCAGIAGIVEIAITVLVELCDRVGVAGVVWDR